MVDSFERVFENVLNEIVSEEQRKMIALNFNLESKKVNTGGIDRFELFGDLKLTFTLPKNKRAEINVSQSTGHADITLAPLDLGFKPDLSPLESNKDLVAINLIRGYFDKSLEMEITNWDQCGDILLTTRIIQSDDYKKQLCIKVKNFPAIDGQLTKFAQNILHSITLIDRHSLLMFIDFVPDFWNPPPFLFLIELWYDNIIGENPDGRASQ